MYIYAQVQQKYYTIMIIIIIIIIENDHVRRRRWCDSVHKQSTHTHAHIHTETRARARTVAGSDICLRRGRVACPPPLSAHSTSTHCIPPRRIPLNARAGRRRRRRRRLSRRGRLTHSISIARLLSSAAAARQFYNIIFTLFGARL
ncbi:unnamed protein product [Aphis gossypii]|uniref:Uncharacterized protein n=1 Tax=Aphis gossypii TaxID=80765 RepID=A0A9P0NKW4_APHGO|nr:unnamed protein product [Aphis gossypii]